MVSAVSITFDQVSVERWLQECATMGSGIPVCRKAQTKLEVCLYMFLWSPDTEAVLVAMSCFRHLCEEADIRSAADEVPIQTILPNYATFNEVASVSIMMGTGQDCSVVCFYLLLTCDGSLLAF